MAETINYEVIIIGGSYAGLSAAMSLGRSLRHVLIIDGGQPCNAQTPHSHNFITQDGVAPAVIAQKAKEQVLNYETVKFINDFAVGGTRTATGFDVTTRTGGTFHAEKLIFATGIKDTLPNIVGLAACWGISVIHCPYCHGYEFRTRKTAILANGGRAFHLASLVNNLTDDITILTANNAELEEAQRSKLSTRGIEVITTPLAEIVHENGRVKQVVFDNGRRMAFDAIYAAVPFTQHSDIPLSLGCALDDNGRIKVDPMQKTSVDGVFACGDNSSMMRSVAWSVATGNIAGAMANHALTAETF